MPIQRLQKNTKMRYVFKKKITFVCVIKKNIISLQR